jgi:L-fuconolactonase
VVHVVDTHVHLVSDDTDRFPRQINASATHPWWAGGHHDSDALLREMAVQGVTAAVVVQAVGVYGYDNSYLVAATANAPKQLAGVVALDADADDVGGELTLVARTDGVAGARLFGVAPGSSWTTSGKADEAFDAADRAGLPLVLTVFEHQLPALMPSIGRYPGLRLALDHCGFAALDRGRVRRASPVLDLTAYGNVTLKVSSHTLLDIPSAGSPADFVDHLLSLFGPDRLMWGSDWPQTPLPDYGAHLQWAERATGHLLADLRAKLMGQNALAWLGDRSLTIVAAMAAADAVVGQGEHDDADQ